MWKLQGQKKSQLLFPVKHFRLVSGLGDDCWLLAGVVPSMADKPAGMHSRGVQQLLDILFFTELMLWAGAGGSMQKVLIVHWGWSLHGSGSIAGACDL